MPLKGQCPQNEVHGSMTSAVHVRGQCACRVECVRAPATRQDEREDPQGDTCAPGPIHRNRQYNPRVTEIRFWTPLPRNVVTFDNGRDSVDWVPGTVLNWSGGDVPRMTTPDGCESCDAGAAVIIVLFVFRLR